MKLEIKSNKEFIRKIGILIIGIPNGVFVGLVWYVLMEEGFSFFLKWKFLFTMIFFGIIGGIFLGFMWGNILWNIYMKKNEDVNGTET